MDDESQRVLREALQTPSVQAYVASGPQFTPAELELIADLAAGPLQRRHARRDELKALRTKALSLLFLEAAKDAPTHERTT